MSQHEQTIVKLFKEAAWEVDRKRFDDIDLDRKISDFGIDSVAMLEVIGYLEDELEIHLPDEKVGRVQTLRDLSNVIQEVAPGAITAGDTGSRPRA